jgi:CheY-like chemotaxis protein
MADSKKTILIVEDSPVQALAALKLLESQGLNILCAANGEAGLEMARQSLPEVILLDVQMPGIDGLEVCRRLQADARTVSIPIILLTTHTDLDTLREGFEDGAIDFIPKDAFYETVLLATLRQLEIIE